MSDPINIRTLAPGTRIALADGAVAEIVSNPEDGVWLFARYIESPGDPARVGQEEMIFAQDVVQVRDAGAGRPEERPSPNAAQIAFWNSPASRAWADRHEPIDRLFAEVTEAALRIAAPQPGERALDIGCGGGTTLFELAKRVGPTGHVLGADISENSVGKLRERIAAAGLRNAEAVLADVSTHQFERGCFDLAFSRLGVMFFADPTATFVNLRQAMKPSGRLAFAVFRNAAENPFSIGPLGAVRHLLPAFAPPGPDEPGMFSWSDPGRVRRILEGAGFIGVSLTPCDPQMRFAEPGQTAEAAELAMMVGHVSRALSGRSPEQREAVRAALVAFFESHDGPDGIALPGALWLVQARAP